MDVLSPWYFFHLLWLFPSILILYFLKLKREEVVVPSVLLWQRAFEDLRVNSPFQRLTKNLLLFLQLLFAAILILAMMRPLLTEVGYASGEIFLLIDTSGSMATEDGSGDRSRLDEAKAIAREIVREMTRDDQAMIVSFAKDAQTLTQLTGRRADLERAIANLEQTHETTNLAAAIRLTKGFVHSDRPPQVVVISDGAFDNRAFTADEALPQVEFISVGREAGNLAVLSVDARKSLENEGLLQITATIANHGRTPQTVPATFYLEGQPIGVREAEVPGASEGGAPGLRTITFDDLGTLSGALEVRLDAKDPLPADDHGFLDIRPSAEVRVLIVSEEGDGNLERGLASDPRAVIETATPAEYDERFSVADGTVPPYELVIFDACVPARLGHPRTVFFGAVPDLEGLSADGEVERLVFLDQSYDHPLTRFVNFAPLRVAKSLSLVAPPEAEILWESTETPVLLTIADEGRQVVVCGFTTEQCPELILGWAWPLLLANLLDWMGGAAAVTGALREEAGNVVTLTVPEGHEALEITLPGGEVRTRIRAPGSDAIFFAETKLSGFYDVLPTASLPGVEPAGSRKVAVNFASEAESRIAPRDSLDLPGVGEVGAVGGASDVQTSREVWRWVVLAALGLLLLEWWWYHNRLRTM